MTNKEYWTGRVEDKVLRPDTMALIGGTPMLCDTADCAKCDFNGGNSGDYCLMRAYEWLNAEYTGPDAPPLTRIEWLRYASVEEVAKFVYDNDDKSRFCESTDCPENEICESKCLKCVVEWLNKPMEDTLNVDI